MKYRNYKGICKVCNIFHIDIDCPKGGEKFGEEGKLIHGVKVIGDRGDAEGPQQDESGPRKTKMEDVLLDVGTVTLWEVSGEKDKKTGENKKFEMNKFHSHCIHFGLLQDIGQAFTEEAERMGVVTQVEYSFTTSEF